MKKIRGFFFVVQTAKLFCFLLDFSLSNTAMEALVARYNNKSGRITFDTFVHINIRLIRVFGKLILHNHFAKMAKQTMYRPLS